MRVLLVSLLLSVPAFGADARLLALADPQADVLIGARIVDLIESPLFETAFAQARDSEFAWLGIVEQLGPNPLANVEEVLIAARTEAGGDRGIPNEDALVLVKTSLQVDTIEAALCSQGCARSTYSGRTLFEGGGLKQGGWTALEPGYLALGPRERITAAIDRANGSTAELDWTGGFVQRHVWFAAKGPFEAPQGEQAQPMFDGAVDSLQSVSGGLTFGQDVDLGLAVLTTSPEDANRLFGMLQGFLGMISAAAVSNPEGSSPGRLLDGLDLHVDGASILASLRVPAEEIQRQVNTAARARVESEAKGTAVPSPTPEPSPSKGSIRIYGLGPEPVEIGQ